MAYCKNCGAPIDDDAAFCPKCGQAVHPDMNSSYSNNSYQTPPSNSYYNSTPPVVDNGGFCWGLLGFCIPIVGLILFLVWRDEKPRTSKAAGMGALISVIISVVVYVLTLIFGIGVSLL